METSFSNIAGYENEKKSLKEICLLLQRFKELCGMGIRLPRGLLLKGDPGVGKTVMAEALIAEAGVPCIRISAGAFTDDELVEYLEKRYSEAEESTPSIVFIDELDKMVGDATNYRTSYNIANTRKVLQVINEHKDHGILTVATVNDTEMLCDALKRSGRFDRILSIGLPDQKERQMIAAFYLKGKKVAHGVSISMISKMTSGMSGADIECIINEAGIHAVLEGSKEIRQSDIVFALDRKVFKAVSRENSWSPEQRRHTAVHESGHLVAALLLQPDDVTGATILPQGESEGHTVVAWDDEDIHNLATIQNRITILLAGKVSEQVFYPGETFLGDSQDLTTAMKLARNLVQEHGIYGYDLCYFSEHYYPDPISDEKLIRIEKKVADILKESADQARKLIEDNKELATKLITRLTRQYSLTREEIRRMFRSVKKWESKAQNNSKI